MSSSRSTVEWRKFMVLALVVQALLFVVLQVALINREGGTGVALVVGYVQALIALALAALVWRWKGKKVPGVTAVVWTLIAVAFNFPHIVDGLSWKDGAGDGVFNYVMLVVTLAILASGLLASTAKEQPAPAQP